MTSVKVKHHQVEIYAFIVNEIINQLEEANTQVTMSIDMGSCFGSKFMALRLYYVENNFEFETHLLSLKYFCPSFRLRTSLELSKALKSWAISSSVIFRIREEHILGSVTDKGTDIKEMAKNCPGSFGEWCMHASRHVV